MWNANFKSLENIADRIILRIKNEIIEIEKVKIKISKINPPINGDVQKVSVIFQYWNIILLIFFKLK